MVTAILSLMLFFTSCTKTTEKPQKQVETLSAQDTLLTANDVESHKNQEAFLKGRIQKFTPWTKGKGANHMFWDWEIVLYGGGTYPMISKDSAIDIGKFENKNVIIQAKVFYGIVIGSEEGQNATGYRIDAENIFSDASLMDTCRTYQDLESHQNQDAFTEGKIIEYIPPHDNSKLGDEKIWDWEIVLSDKYKYPLISKNASLDVNNFIGKNVIVKGKVFSGIIFGEENTANISGIRIDAEEIYLK